MPFSVDFNVSAHSGRMWIRPWWGDRSSEVELVLKGVNWFGTAGSRMCFEEISLISVDEYISFLVQNEFNAVRIPLSVATLLSNPTLTRNDQWGCGEWPRLSAVLQR